METRHVSELGTGNRNQEVFKVLHHQGTQMYTVFYLLIHWVKNVLNHLETIVYIQILAIFMNLNGILEVD